ncbi:septum formation family protein [Nocardioides stalactiti]|uniref:septum formation family protein n=1 Tax=Nocardioides stalactiti TaxID=2755356 RepID=UPI0015FEE488|nr:septum formation family protein [Nocardioides stalactiti]
MKLRLGAAVLLAALIPLTAVTSSSPASAGTEVDITPPAVGSCHDLTWDEFYSAAEEPEAPVDCAGPHTSLTVRVTEIDPVDDWEASWGDIVNREYVPCLKALVAATGGRPDLVLMSTYRLTFYRPTEEQREAGASWVRCDAVVWGKQGTIMRMPTDVVMDGSRPPASVRRCLLGKRQDYATVVCTMRHQYIATWAFKMPHDRYPGERRAKEFAHRKCHDKLGSGDWVYTWIYKSYWRAGLRYAVCSPAD